MKKVWTTILIYILILIFVDYNVAYSKIYMINKYDKLSYYYSWINPILYHHIRKNSIKYKVPEELICAVIQHESRGKNIRGKRNKNGTRDFGLMQVNEVHSNGNHHILYKYKVNIQIGVHYLSRCLKKSHGNIKETCRMYNQGLNARKSRYKNWKYVERIYADYKNLTEKI